MRNATSVGEGRALEWASSDIISTSWTGSRRAAGEVEGSAGLVGWWLMLVWRLTGANFWGQVLWLVGLSFFIFFTAPPPVPATRLRVPSLERVREVTGPSSSPSSVEVPGSFFTIAVVVAVGAEAAVGRTLEGAGDRPAFSVLAI